MHILCINCGSSTLRWDVWQLDDSESRTASGSVERIGSPDAASDHAAAVSAILDTIIGRDDGLIRLIDAVGHRVVHGGPHFRGPAVITAEVLDRIEEAAALAPLHNRPALAAVRKARDALPAVPMVAVFDTAFFADLPDTASHYAIDLDIAERHSIRRYGFHGLAHEWMASDLAAHEGAAGRFVTMQLGNGCSVTATLAGRPIDTSMGFTPLEGLVMGTRSGDIDPAAVPYLARQLGLSLDEVEDFLNRSSGLLGVSGVSSDMREVVAAAESGNRRAALAIDLFCYRAQKYFGAYAAALGGIDALAFGGGIGENNPRIRERILAPLGWLGVDLDPARNAALGADGGLISRERSRVRAYVVPVNESLVIARATRKCLREAEEGGERAF